MVAFFGNKCCRCNEGSVYENKQTKKKKKKKKKKKRIGTISRKITGFYSRGISALILIYEGPAKSFVTGFG